MYITVLRPKERSLLYIFFFYWAWYWVCMWCYFYTITTLWRKKSVLIHTFIHFLVSFFLNFVPSIRGNSGNFLSWSKFWSFFLVLTKQCMTNTAVRKINKWVMINNNVCLILAVFCARGNSQYIYIKTPILLTPH